MKIPRRKLNIILFWLYCAVMLYLLFNRQGGTEGVPYWDQIRRNLNLEPMHTVKLFLNALDNPDYTSAALVNLNGNVVMFIPLGLLLPQVFPKCSRLWTVLLISTLAISLVELTQLFTLLGCCDIDDLILNLVGTLIGYGIYAYQSKKPAP